MDQKLNIFLRTIYGALGDFLGVEGAPDLRVDAKPQMRYPSFPLAPAQVSTLPDEALLGMIKSSGPFDYYGFVLSAGTPIQEIRRIFGHTQAELEAHEAKVRFDPKPIIGLLVEHPEVGAVFSRLVKNPALDITALVAGLPEFTRRQVINQFFVEWGLFESNKANGRTTLTSKGKAVWDALPPVDEGALDAAIAAERARQQPAQPVAAQPAPAAVPVVPPSQVPAVPSAPVVVSPPAASPPAVVPPAAPAVASQDPSTFVAFPYSFARIEKAGKVELRSKAKDPRYGLDGLNFEQIKTVAEIRSAIALRLREIVALGGPEPKDNPSVWSEEERTSAGMTSAPATTAAPSVATAPAAAPVAAPVAAPPPVAPPAVAPPPVAPPAAAPAAAPPPVVPPVAGEMEKFLAQVAAISDGGPWAFPTANQNQHAASLQEFMEGQVKQGGEPAQTIGRYFAALKCQGRCTTCPHGPAQPTLCFATADEDYPYSLGEVIARGRPFVVVASPDIRVGIAAELKVIP